MVAAHRVATVVGRTQQQHWSGGKTPNFFKRFSGKILLPNLKTPATTAGRALQMHKNAIDIFSLRNIAGIATVGKRSPDA